MAVEFRLCLVAETYGRCEQFFLGPQLFHALLAEEIEKLAMVFDA
jgi:hypothetical protein